MISVCLITEDKPGISTIKLLFAPLQLIILLAGTLRSLKCSQTFIHLVIYVSIDLGFPIQWVLIGSS